MYLLMIFIMILGVSITIGPIIYNRFIVVPYKNNVLKKALEEIDPTITYSYKDKVKYSVDFIEEYSLINKARNFVETDIIKSPNGVSLDLYAYHVVSSGKSRRRVEDFKGRVYIFKVNNTRLVPFIIKEEKLDRSPDGFQLLDLELISFNDSFNLYVCDTEKSFSVFTPSVIKKICELSDSLSGKIILAYLDGNFIFGEYNQKDWFEDEKTKDAIINEYNKEREIIKNVISIFSNELE